MPRKLQTLERVMEMTYKNPGKDWTARVLDSLLWGVPEEPDIKYEADVYTVPARWKYYSFGRKDEDNEWLPKETRFSLLFYIGIRRFLEDHLDYQPQWNRLFYEVAYPQIDPERDMHWREVIDRFPKWINEHHGHAEMEYGTSTYNTEGHLSRGMSYYTIRVRAAPESRLHLEETTLVFVQLEFHDDPVIFSFKEWEESLDWDRVTLFCPNRNHEAYWDFEGSAYHCYPSIHNDKRFPKFSNREEDNVGVRLINADDAKVNRTFIKRIRHRWASLPPSVAIAPRIRGLPGFYPEPYLWRRIHRAAGFCWRPAAHRKKPLLIVEDEQIVCPVCYRSKLIASY